jgi:hypothetical protein
MPDRESLELLSKLDHKSAFTVALQSRLKTQQEEGRTGVILFSNKKLVSPFLPSSCLILVRLSSIGRS